MTASDKLFGLVDSSIDKILQSIRWNNTVARHLYFAAEGNLVLIKSNRAESWKSAVLQYTN